ncbi:MAG: RNA methyltransferase [Dehalococcoidia bacterium]|nr:RNA methyltransferase [Dehalococcoidia bacterium]
MSSFVTGPLKPIKWYKDLASGRERLAAGAFLVEGVRAVQQVINTAPHAVSEILSTHELPDEYQLYPRRIITEKQLHSISTSRTPQSIIAIVQAPTQIYSSELPDDTGAMVLLLEDIQDPGNTGTLIRSAAAFGFSGVILSDKCADPLSPKCVQSAAGTLLALWLRRTSHYLELMVKLKHTGYTLVAADLRGQENTAVLCNRDRLILALGNEANGLTRPLLDASDFILKVPINHEKAESLNVAACGAICMYLSSRPG